MRKVKGFTVYTLMRTSDGGLSVTVCKDKAGTDESPKRAAAWIEENGTAPVDPPEIAEGSTVLQF